MNTSVLIGSRHVGHDNPVYIIAEIGINHNGSVELAKRLIDGAILSGCDAVKFQKRTPELCVPREQWFIERDTPWGRMTYLEYRKRIEFGYSEFDEIDRHCKERGIQWFASCWDVPSVEFIEQFSVPCYKIASASLTDSELLMAVRGTGKPIILSTGMSTIQEIVDAVEILGTDNLLLAHATSTYPCKPEELNLRMIETLRKMYKVPVGYSGHETGLATTWAAVALGACFVERHITLDRALWGTDQAASVELGGLMRLVSNIRDVEKAIGDGIKKVYDSELASRSKLRRVQSTISESDILIA
ncbi:MAG: N-acetylneuraminate synthase family protein [Candidatus Kapabacteria bacterium]|nr:N-acetylneuraminate synthase family protein [Candidatus Kapabacteria bacterium]